MVRVTDRPFGPVRVTEKASSSDRPSMTKEVAWVRLNV